MIFHIIYVCLCKQRLYRSKSCGSKTHVGVVVLALLFRVRLETFEVFEYRDAPRSNDVFRLPKYQAFLGPGVGSVAASAWPLCLTTMMEDSNERSDNLRF